MFVAVARLQAGEASCRALRARAAEAARTLIRKLAKAEKRSYLYSPRQIQASGRALSP